VESEGDPLRRLVTTLQTRSYRQRIQQGKYVDGSLDDVVDELADLWVAAGDQLDADAQDAVGQLLDQATDRLDEAETTFAERLTA
jgi:hypothetical protein